MKKISVAIMLIVITVFTACSKKSSVSKIVKKTTYSSDVFPLIQAKCTPCHLPSQKGFKANFENYESAKKYSAEMLDRIQLNPGGRGFMPFKHDKLSVEEIAVFKKWIDDGLLDK